MNWDQIQGQWKEWRGRAKAAWGKLTHHDLDVIQGKREQLIGKLEKIYGLAKEEAERQVDAFGSNLKVKRVRLVIRRTVKRSTPKPPSKSKKEVSSKR